MKILGIDPGLGRCGFGLIETTTRTGAKALDYGVVTTTVDAPLPSRLKELHDSLTEVFDQTKPDLVAVEKLFFAKNITTGIAVAEARGIVLLVAEQKNVIVYEYTPNEIKKSLTGYGAANKTQMQEMVRVHLGLENKPKPDDAADALAAAITCAFLYQTSSEEKYKFSNSRKKSQFFEAYAIIYIMRVNIRSSMILSLMGFTALSFLVLSSSSALADSSTVSTASITIDESCTMSGTTNTAHTADLVNGTYSGTNYPNGIGQTTLKVFCNDNNGFAIYAIGYTNDEYGNNKLHWSGATSTSDITNDINTGIYSSGATTSSWSMKLSAMSGTYAATIDDGVAANNNSTDNFTNWHIVPTEYKRVAYRTSGTDLNTNNNGTGSSITTTYDAYVSATQPAGTYVGQVKYTLVHPSTAPAPITEYIMQNVADWKNSLAPGQEVQAKDSRDNKVYYVAKLADGNIWMTQNLDHDIGDTTGGTYTSADTDLPTNTSWTPSASEQTYTTNNTTWNYSLVASESYDPGDLCWTGNLGDGTLATETESCTQNGNHYHIGNYYNWTAAVAMSDSSSVDTDVNQSICPAGWMLPKSDDDLTGSGSFINLVTEYGWDDSDNTFAGSYTAWGEPLNLALGGYWYGASYNVASTSYFWSSVVSDDDFAYNLYISNDGYAYPQDYDNRNYGLSVRCVARP